MSRTTVSVIYGVTGQTVELRVIEGRPTSATFAVFNDFDGDDAVARFTGTATVDSVTQTLTGASGQSQADPTKINVTSTGVVTSRKYLISEGSRQEWISPVEIGTGYIIARHPLQNDYTTAATFVSTTLTAAIDSTFVADLTNLRNQIDPNPSYRVRWSISVNGSTIVNYSFFDLVRAQISYQVDMDDLDARAPGLMDSCPPQYRVEQGRPLLDAAWRSVVARFAALRIDMDAMRDDSIVDELVTLRALNLLACAGWRPLGYDSHAQYVADTQANYDRFVEQHFQIVQPHKMAAGILGAADRVRLLVIGK